MAVYLRKVDESDAEKILEWRNDPTVRNSSFSKEIIDEETHKRWFAGKMADKGCFMYMAVDNDTDVGHIRVDKTLSTGAISYMTSPDKRGMGYGKEMIRLIDDELPPEIMILNAVVENTNEASKKCFLANGYTEFITGNTAVYIKALSALL